MSFYTISINKLKSFEYIQILKRAESGELVVSSTAIRNPNVGEIHLVKSEENDLLKVSDYLSWHSSHRYTREVGNDTLVKRYHDLGVKEDRTYEYKKSKVKKQTMHLLKTQRNITLVHYFGDPNILKSQHINDDETQNGVSKLKSLITRLIKPNIRFLSSKMVILVRVMMMSSLMLKVYLVIRKRKQNQITNLKRHQTNRTVTHRQTQTLSTHHRLWSKTN